jgi:hypothetical protein
MGRFGLAVGLTLLGLMVSGCSSYYVDAANYRQQRAVAADDPSPRGRVASSRASRRAMAADAYDVGTTGASDDIKPWPKQGTAEWDRMQAKNDEIERRARAATSNICRGC